MKITQSFLLLLNLDSLLCLVEPSIELSSQDLELLSLKIGREVHRDYADAYAVSGDYADAPNELLPTPKFKGYIPIEYHEFHVYNYPIRPVCKKASQCTPISINSKIYIEDSVYKRIQRINRQKGNHNSMSCISTICHV